MGKVIKRAVWILLLGMFCVLSGAKFRRYLMLKEAAAGMEAVFFPQTLGEKTEQKLDELVIRHEKEEAKLPAFYDYREEGRAVPVRNQGFYGTCWAFASLTALETALMPEEETDFSRDHLNFNNSYALSTEEGGSYIMALAYLAAWQGPVLEQDDPYGDNYSPEGLAAVKHVQIVRMPDHKHYDAIKQTVYLYSGVESSLYMDFDNPHQESDYYSREHASYCYNGDAVPNHDIVIIGWDDGYPAEKFKNPPEGDGAFICQNSWGEDFGDSGIFYVSYYDTNIGTYNLAYTRVDDTDNYDTVYQSDLCGWSGQIGYNSNTGYFANVYETQGTQELQAVGFYATGGDTEYRLAVVPDFQDADSLKGLAYLQGGYLQYSGFYTIELDEPVTVRPGQKFAVAVWITTPEVLYPIAAEFAAADLKSEVDLEDGEGYISPNGKDWERVEEGQESNLCLKVYAKEQP